MNIIEELIEKYNGKYSENLTKSLNSPIGKYVYQPKKGIIQVDGTKISINLNDVGGAMPVTEPFRIILHLDKSYESELTVFPKNLWKKFIDFVLPKKREFFSMVIREQFSFKGNKDLLRQLASDKLFIENIINERIYITTGESPISRIVLTPEYGIKDIEQFEKFVSILKRIEYQIKTSPTIK